MWVMVASTKTCMRTYVYKIKMALKLLLLVFAVCSLTVGARAEDDFAEFDNEEGEYDFDLPGDDKEVEDEQDNEFDDEEEATVEDEDEDVFEVDVEEFETKTSSIPVDKIEISEAAVKQKVTWEAYVIEILIGSGMALYFINYIVGRSRNGSMAQSWFDSQKDLLNSNFALVGDTGEGEEPTEGEMVRESDNTFMIWSSGRSNCLGMAIQLELLHRHDIFNMLIGLYQGKKDTVNIFVQLGDEDMDSFVLALGRRKALQKMQKEYEDMNHYLTGTMQPLGNDEKLRDFFLLTEIRDASSIFFSDRVLSLIGKNRDILESIHISDQYTGLVQENEDSDVVVAKKPEKKMRITFKVRSLDESDCYLKFALHLLDQIRLVRLNRESKDKAIRNRTKVAQELDKLQHSQRQEAAKQRREEKKKQEKEKMMNETDPEKTRKWEERENRRARKKMQSKMAKSMKVRATA